MSELRHLRMINAPMRLAGLAAFLTSPMMTSLESLSVQHVGEGSTIRAVQQIAEPVAVPSLRIVSLRYCRFHAGGLKQILKSGALARVEVLSLFGNYDLGEAGVAAITSSDQFENLRRLDLDTCGFNAAGLRTISKWERLSQLHSLNLRGNAYKSVAVAEQLAEAVKESGTRVTIDKPGDLHQDTDPDSPISKRWQAASQILNQGLS